MPALPSFLFQGKRIRQCSSVFPSSYAFFTRKVELKTCPPYNGDAAADDDDRNLERLVINHQTSFATKLATCFMSGEFRHRNLLFSPISVHMILGLIASGSNDAARRKLLDFLETDTTMLHYLHSQLLPKILMDGTKLGGPHLRFANRIWVDHSLFLTDSFRKDVETVYEATCTQLDFLHESEWATEEINSWAKDQTHGLIKELLPPNTLDNVAWILLTNVICFKGDWRKKFDGTMTKVFDFHLYDGRKVRVPFMTSNEDQFVCKFDNFKVLGLPYSQGEDNREFKMYIFLPDAKKDGIESLVQKIGSIPNFLESHLPLKKVKVGNFLVPKFEISSAFEASDMLIKQLGINLPRCLTNVLYAFHENIPYPLLGLMALQIYHKSFLMVCENGAEAASICAFEGRGCSFDMEDDTVDFVADHPFIFVIREDVSGLIVFMGQLTNPDLGILNDACNYYDPLVVDDT